MRISWVAKRDGDAHVFTVSPVFAYLAMKHAVMFSVPGSIRIESL